MIFLFILIRNVVNTHENCLDEGFWDVGFFELAKNSNLKKKMGVGGWGVVSEFF